MPRWMLLLALVACNKSEGTGDEDDGSDGDPESDADTDADSDTDTDTDTDTDADTDASPDISVDPMQIDFGPVDAGASASEVLTISNEGASDLHIEDLAVVDAGGSVTVGSISSTLIRPGESATVAVDFSPSTCEDLVDTVQIDSDDPDEGTVEVLVLGQGLAPIIDVDPMEYDFGSVEIGETEQQAVSILNIGCADLTVSGFTFTSGSDDLAFEEPAKGGWTLAEGESIEGTYTYAPTNTYADDGYLFVYSDDPFTPQVIGTVSGTGY